jgi:hypothetical protein
MTRDINSELYYTIYPRPYVLFLTQPKIDTDRQVRHGPSLTITLQSREPYSLHSYMSYKGSRDIL